MTAMTRFFIGAVLCAGLGLLVWKGLSRLLTSWAESRPQWTGPEVAPFWFVPLQPRSEPIVANKDTVLIVASEADGSARLVALDVRTGKERWRSAGPVESIVDANRRHVVVREPGGGGRVLALDTGAPVAEATPDTWVSVAWDGDSGFGVARDGRLAAFESTGLRWVVPSGLDGFVVIDDIAITAETAVVRANARTQEGPYVLAAYARATGAPLWRHGGNGPRSLTRPLTTRDAVFVVEEGPSKTTSVVTQNPDGSTTSRAVAGLGEHSLVALDAATGAIRFRVTIAGASPAALPVLLALDGDAVIMRAWDDSLHDRIRAYSPADGRVLWESEPGGGSTHLGRAVVRGGLLAVRDRRGHALLNEAGATTPDSSLFVIDARTGQELWHSTMFELMDMSDPVTNGQVVVTSVARSDGGSGDSKGVSGVAAWRFSRDGQ